MRDIRDDLQGRAERLKQEINSENARYEGLLRDLTTKRDSSLEHLKAQRRLANKLLEFTAWQDRLRAELAARIAVAEAAEGLIRDRPEQNGEPAEASQPAAEAPAPASAPDV